MYIDINDHTDSLTELQIDLLRKVLLYTAESEDVGSKAELSVSVVTNEEIKVLNNNYRNKNEATDVLSFPIDNPFPEGNADFPFLLGDIIISIDKVIEQSANYHHSFERELIFLAVHGLLHLLGFTHENVEDEKVMFEKQDKILKVFQLER